MKVSIIIVSYNSEDFIAKCIASLLKEKSQNTEIIVLDNASKDQTVKRLEKFLPNIKLITSDKNLGFSRGNNLAIKSAKGEYLFILNPDTELEKNIIPELINFYEKTDGIGMVGPKLIMPNGQIQSSVKKLPTIWGAFQEFVLGIKNSYSQYVPESKEPVEVEAIYGAALLIKRDLFWEVGGFDERYFLYYEDVELCRKVSALGKKIFYYPLAEVKHLVGGTKSEIDKQYLNYQSSKIYHGVVGAFILSCIFVVPRIKRRFFK